MVSRAGLVDHNASNLRAESRDPAHPQTARSALRRNREKFRTREALGEAPQLARTSCVSRAPLACRNRVQGGGHALDAGAVADCEASGLEARRLGAVPERVGGGTTASNGASWLRRIRSILGESDGEARGDVGALGVWPTGYGGCARAAGARAV